MSTATNLSKKHRKASGSQGQYEEPLGRRQGCGAHPQAELMLAWPLQIGECTLRLTDVPTIRALTPTPDGPT